MDMIKLGAELQRLGCGVTYCGAHHGFIFEPRTGGLNIEHGALHFWDTGVNVCLNLKSAKQVLATLPNNAGIADVRKSLLSIDPE